MMGKGDKKTAKGKRFIKSFGKCRPKKSGKATSGATAPKTQKDE
jgi:ribosomal small subunit protein bTHX